MTDLALIVPTRGRPERFAALVRAVADTAAGDVVIVAGVDEDDPERKRYEELVFTYVRVMLAVEPRACLSVKTNQLAEAVLGWPEPPRYLASLGDDHRPRTAGWDRRLTGAIDALCAPGIAYGDDRYQGAALPTAWVVSTEVVERVGWMMLPACQHMYVDNAVLALGQASGRIVYCPDVVIEHEHPKTGKAAWDESYLESNSTDRYAADRAAFLEWHRGGGLAADVAKLTGGARR